MLLFPILISPLFRDRAKRPKSNTTKVVTLSPPAVDPELPPININIIVKRELLSDKEAVSIVLNPAVLGVIAWKSEARKASPADIFFII